MTLLAAFDVLVYRYTGQADVVVGTPVANRNRKELEGLIGFFVNTLVLRTDLSGNPTFRELLERVRQVASGAFVQQDFPFEMLVEELQPRRDLSRNPLFQVMFALQNAPTPSLEMAGLTLRPLDVDDGMARFDLLVSVWDVEQGLLGSFEYNTDLFEATTITRLAGHFQTLLQGIVAAPAQPICDLPLLTEAERQQVLVEWNTTTTDYGQTYCIHELFEAQVEQTPDATALSFPSLNFARHPERSEWTGRGEHHHLTYRELNRRANQLAHHLRALGVGPETRVGICVERSPEMVIGLYGILKAGAAYVPLDPAYPVERLAFMLADAQVPVLLSHEALVSKLPPHQAQVLCLDADWATIARQGDHNPAVRLADENLAYVIYTSGSTGRPKGAMNTHGGIRNRLLWMQEAYQLGPADRVIQKTPFSFDVSVWEFFWPLLYGACLVVARPEGHKDSAYLIQTIVEQHVTTMHFVPSMLQMFVDERGVEACRSLKRVICSGEALPFDLTERFFACLEAELHNLYGPTEAAVDVTFWPCQRESERRVVPIGRPIANTQIYLLDAHLMPVPVGVPGELHIGGAGLARGYHHRPGLTAERFIPAPSFACSSGGETAARLYKTGDLARYLPHGDIEFLGRTDFQVKVRGFRIELGETEAVLGEHPAIRETVVVAAPVTPADGAGDGRAASWDSRLVAYVVPNQGQEPLVDELRRFMLEKLPEYMVPSVFVTLEALPLSPNGKVDRRALPAPDGARPEMETVYVAPRGEAERTIAAIWREVLRVEQVGVNDNFFDLGGHSLLVVQVHHQLTATFEKEFPMTDMFKYTTVAALAQHLSQAQEQTDIVQKTKERAAARRASLRRRARSR
jgi:amino acid adenylation domain-containing protein